MKAGWEVKPFEDCIKKVTYSNKIQRKDFLAEGAYPIISQEEDFINGYWNIEADKFKVEKPVVIFGDHTKVLKYIDFDFVLGADGVKILPPLDFLEPKFFYYQLQTANLEALGYARHYKLLKALNIVYPSLHEQQRIVAILDQAFEGIAKARANAEKNLQNARGLFESHLQSAFTQRGDGWLDTKLGEVCEFENGDRGVNYPSKSVQTSTGVPFINAGHLLDDGLDFETMNYIPEERFNLLRAGKIKPNDILFCLRGSLGKCASVGSLDQGAIASSLVIIRAKENLNIEFLLAYLRSHICTQMISKYSNGAAQPNLSAQSLKQFSILIPPLHLQERVVNELNELRKETQRLEALYQRKIACLDELKKSLLQQAFAGEL